MGDQLSGDPAWIQVVGIEPVILSNFLFSADYWLSINQLAFYDNDLSLLLETGKIIMLGSSSDDIHLSGEFEISGPHKMPIQERVFFCPVDIE